MTRFENLGHIQSDRIATIRNASQQVLRVPTFPFLDRSFDRNKFGLPNFLKLNEKFKEMSLRHLTPFLD